MDKNLPWGLALPPPPATAIPAVQEEARGGLGTALHWGDVFPERSGPATAASYGVYPAFLDPFRVAPYGNMVFREQGYPAPSLYPAWTAPRVGSRDPAPCANGGWPRTVPAGACARFDLTYPQTAYRAL